MVTNACSRLEKNMLHVTGCSSTQSHTVDCHCHMCETGRVMHVCVSHSVLLLRYGCLMVVQFILWPCVVLMQCYGVAKACVCVVSCLVLSCVVSVLCFCNAMGLQQTNHSNTAALQAFSETISLTWFIFKEFPQWKTLSQVHRAGSADWDNGVKTWHWLCCNNNNHMHEAWSLPS